MFVVSVVKCFQEEKEQKKNSHTDVYHFSEASLELLNFVHLHVKAEVTAVSQRDGWYSSTPLILICFFTQRESVY